MLVSIPRIDALFTQTIKELESKGVTPTPPESVWLHTLCTKCVRPDRLEVNPWLPPSVVLGELRLWPITVQAQLWLSEHASKWFSGGDMDALSVAYAMAHAREAGHFESLTDREAARQAVQWWAVKIPYTFAQVREAIGRWLGDDGSIELGSVNQAAPDPMEWGTILSSLSWHYKLSPETVMQMPLMLVSEMLQNIPGRDKPVVDSASMHALEALRLAKQKIVESHKEPAHGE